MSLFPVAHRPSTQGYVDLGRPLPDGFRKQAERFLGHDLSTVRYCTSALPLAVQARAFTSGHRLVFAPGQFCPDGVDGQKLLIHELAHVVQQRALSNVSCEDKVTLLDDPELEEEANDLAEQFLASGRAARWTITNPRRLCPGNSESGCANVIQCQRWGILARDWIRPAPSDYAAGVAGKERWAEVLGEVTGGKQPENKGLFALYNPQWDGTQKPSQAIPRGGVDRVPDSLSILKYNSTACENETYATRGNAWTRAVALATAIVAPTAFNANTPQYVYCIRSDANQRLDDVELMEATLIMIGTTVMSPQLLIWVRYKDGNSPEAGGIGNYFDYGLVSGGKKLLIVEHTEDAEATLEKHTAAKPGAYALTARDSKATVQHFHIVCYDQSKAEYIPINTRADAFDKTINAPGGGMVIARIRESALLTAREGYEEWPGVPSHHLYYLAP